MGNGSSSSSSAGGSFVFNKSYADLTNPEASDYDTFELPYTASFTVTGMYLQNNPGVDFVGWDQYKAVVRAKDSLTAEGMPSLYLSFHVVGAGVDLTAGVSAEVMQTLGNMSKSAVEDLGSGMWAELKSAMTLSLAEVADDAGFDSQQKTDVGVTLGLGWASEGVELGLETSAKAGIGLGLGDEDISIRLGVQPSLEFVGVANGFADLSFTGNAALLFRSGTTDSLTFEPSVSIALSNFDVGKAEGSYRFLFDSIKFTVKSIYDVSNEGDFTTVGEDVQMTFDLVWGS